MGCDYYIIKELKVKHTYNDVEYITCIELDRERAYFPDLDDSQDSDDSTDSESSTSRFNRKYGKYLEVNYKPRVLFENGKWKTEKIQKKYYDIVRNEIRDDVLVSIVKQEVRYLR